jgi:hypothetical protein
MKRLGWVVVLTAVAAAPAWAAPRKITVQELKDMLAQMQQQKKSDDEMATALKQVEMSEQLTPAVLSTLGSYVAGQQSLAQVYILEARGAMLAPPPSDVPTDPAPDPAAQKALLDKAAAYVSGTYAQLPDLTATKTTIRFQDNTQTVSAGSGMHSGASDATTSFGLSDSPQYFRYINSADSTIENNNGVEKLPATKDTTPWGRNGYIAPEAQGPVLATVVKEAEAAGKINFLRWELVNGKKAAVFTFAVERKKSHYSVNYCCYPDTDQAGTAHFTSAAIGSLNGGGGGGAKGNFQTNTTWTPFKATVGYHGELYVNAETGIIVRLVNDAEFKSTDVIHQEETRIDFDPVAVGDKAMVLPDKAFLNTEDVPAGEDAAGKFSLRHTLFYTEYKNYQLAGAH